MCGHNRRRMLCHEGAENCKKIQQIRFDKNYTYLQQSIAPTSEDQLSNEPRTIGRAERSGIIITMTRS